MNRLINRKTLAWAVLLGLGCSIAMAQPHERGGGMPPPPPHMNRMNPEGEPGGMDNGMGPQMRHRRGEEFRNVWEQLQKEKTTGGQYQIVPFTKSNKPRTIKPPAIAFDYLKREQKRQAMNRLQAGQIWTNPHNLVFTNDFGGNLDGSTQFTWPSIIRLGREAEFLTHEATNMAIGKQTLSTYSSPKRYLWDFKERPEEWRFVNLKDSTDRPPILKGITNYFDYDGALDTDGYGTGANYSRKTLMTFAFLHILTFVLRK